MSRKFTSNLLQVSYLVSQTIFPASFHHKETIIPSFCLPQAIHHVCGCIFLFSNVSVSALVNIKVLDINYGKRDCVSIMHQADKINISILQGSIILSLRFLKL